MAASIDVTTQAPGLREARQEAGRIRVVLQDGRALLFPAIWLRDNCLCALCVSPGNGQRLVDTIALPERPTAQRLLAAGETLTIVWAPDAHESRYSAPWLADHAFDDASRLERHPEPLLWGPEVSRSLPKADWSAVESRPADERALLDSFLRYGFAILSGVPTESGMVTRVGDRIGHVRVTNYGRWFEVKSVPNPNNLAYTGLGLGVHTDNPYRDPTPGVQLLHCLECEAPGGDSILVDGFRAAADFRNEDPDGFALLTHIAQDYRFADREADLRARTPVIGTDADGRVVGIHFNNRSKAPLDAPLELVEPWYRAYRRFATLMGDPSRALMLRLEPGDLLMMANQRTLHGRTAFDPSLGRRHLQGCYVDMDGVESRHRVLGRDSHADMRAESRGAAA
ncbi:MAG: TauD/TfdA family dioxygenase [Rhodospirillaceae bacterium]|nr:TauD/TfdA family dioxygenase [Rhodospirillaceae bacterium]